MKRRFRLAGLAGPAALVTFTLLATPFLSAGWKPAKARLLTRWASDVTPETAWRQYPRPQLVRDDWLCLNGLWQYAVRPVREGRPSGFEGEILVPYPIESALSGVARMVGESNRLWYRRTFELPRAWKGKRLLLHLGGVDWDSTLWINGRRIGSHRGGYDAFSFDITDALKDSGPQEVVLSAFDPSDAGTQPRGKQVRRPRGIWYTPTTGIWRTVWLEPVPAAHLEGLRIVPDLGRSQVRLGAKLSSAASGLRLRAKVLDEGEVVAEGAAPAAEPLAIEIEKPRTWSPDSPHLYDLEVELVDGEKVVDSARSYFGMREIRLGKDEAGVQRLLLNGEPLFQVGFLDQGFWPDGLYTAPTDDALRHDIEVTRRLGFNLARKHVKVEPDRWYYWADKLGLLVWQDMPSGDRYIGGRDRDLERSEASARQYEKEFGAIIDNLRNHPSIVMWVAFNEGWGQFGTARITRWVRERDPTRLVDSASGWSDRGTGDVHDMHRYPGPGMPEIEERRAAVLGEFGGLGLPLKGHTWQGEKNWGYRSFKSREALTDAYVDLARNLRPLIGRGLSAAVYTQTSDVEIEVNGFMTYDRALVKLDEDRVREANRKLFLPPPEIRPVVPASRREAKRWRYTDSKPAEGWAAPGFDDSGWKEGPGGFGTEGTPGAVVRTEWNGSDLWLRRGFELPPGTLAAPALLVHHDEDAEVYINGHEAARLSGYTTGYVTVALSPEAARLLRRGEKNTLAVHCHQTGGGQYIDVGLVDVIEKGAR